MLFLVLAWRYGFFFLSKILSTFFTRSLGMGLASSHNDLIFKTNFLIPYFRWRKKGAISAFGILANHLASIFFLPLSGDSLGLLYVPVPHSFTHPVTKYKHLLVSILTWIFYLRNWPKFLFQQSVLGLLIQIRRNSSNPPLLLSQWETTWQLAQSGMQRTTSSIWTLVTNSISYNNSHYTKCTFKPNLFALGRIWHKVFFLSGIKLVYIQSFTSSTLVPILKNTFYLTLGGRTDDWCLS